MSILVDPHVCPDCRAPLDPTATCTGCGLRLVGPDASALWEHMQSADRFVERLRAASATAPAVPGSTTPAPTEPPAPRRVEQRLPNASVPVVLLALGGLCLLVAAVVFVAVAWSSLGLAAKTTILVGVTGLLATGAVAVTGRELRLAAETLWLVVAGLVALDLAAAHGSDLLGLGHLSDRDAFALVGAALLGGSVGVSAWVTTTPVRRLHGLVVVAGIGTVLLAGAEAWTSEHNPLAVTLSVPLLAALAAGLDRVTDGHLRPIALVEAVAATVSWLVLVGIGLDRMTTVATDARWWADLSGWPLLAAAALAAALTARLPELVRTVAAGGSLACLALVAVGPGTGPTADLLAWAAVSTVLAGLTVIAPHTWRCAAAALTAVGLLAWSVVVLARPVTVVDRLPATAPPDRARLGLHVPDVAGGPAAWTAIVAAVVVGAAAGALVGRLRDEGARQAAGRAWIALGPGVLALGTVTVLLETGPALVVAVAAWAAVLAAAGAMAVAGRKFDTALTCSLVFLAYLALVGVRLTLPSHLLSAALATGVALALAVASARAEQRMLSGTLPAALAGTAVVAGAFAAAHWPYAVGGRDDAAALTLAGFAAVVLVAARPWSRDAASRITIEACALLAGLTAAALPGEPTVAATALTILGTGLAIGSVLHRDRDAASWLAVALLGAATVIRVVEDVRAPESATLPAALLLLGAGWWRLDRDDRVGSARALGSGLTLALLPSLLIALDDPVTARGALVATAGVVVLAVGVARLWSAPFLAGSATTALLAVRHLGPVVDGLPRWISLGSVGLALLLVGVTWEQRRRDLDAAGRYLTSLR
jgi:hypothetical protein